MHWLLLTAPIVRRHTISFNYTKLMFLYSAFDLLRLRRSTNMCIQISCLLKTTALEMLFLKDFIASSGYQDFFILEYPYHISSPISRFQENLICSFSLSSSDFLCFLSIVEESKYKWVVADYYLSRWYITIFGRGWKWRFAWFWGYVTDGIGVDHGLSTRSVEIRN